jgi:hypothetical protein
MIHVIVGQGISSAREESFEILKNGTVKRQHFHKFGAVPTTTSGIRFGSKKEAHYYEELKIRQRIGEILFFLRQVPFHLPGGTIYRVDFQEFHADGTVHFIDVKGLKTKEFIRNKKQVEALYPVVIEVV